jgi:hypothetical protein
MVKYFLDHLTQNSDQFVFGPIQDDEALLLYSIIRTCNIKTILEVGGLNGYSANNFLHAVTDQGKVYTVDISSVNKIKDNHIVITKNAQDVNTQDIDSSYIGLVFFDAHAYDEQMQLLNNLISSNLIDDNTIIALHDTNTHPLQVCSWSYQTNDGWIHQPVERNMVNTLVDDFGYNCINFHTQPSNHNNSLPFRHGISILKKFKHLSV